MKRPFILLFLSISVILLNYLTISYLNYSTTGYGIIRVFLVIVNSLCAYQLIKRTGWIRQLQDYLRKNGLDHSAGFLASALIGIVIFVLMHILTDGLNKRLLSNNYQAIMAEILWCEEDYCVCAYEVEGGYYEQRLNNLRPQPREGDLFEIIYYRENPNIYEIVR